MNSQMAEIRKILVHAIEGDASPYMLERLNEILFTSQEARNYYFEFMDIVAISEHICSSEIFFDEKHLNDSELSKDKELLSILAEKEKNAQKIDIENDAVVEIKNNTEHAKKTKSKFKFLYNTIFSVAAAVFVFFIIYTNIFPPQISIPVASVVDQIGVKWSKDSDQLEVNDKVLINQLPYKIDEGVVKIVYDSGVEVIIEGPAEFVIEKKGIEISSGRLYSKVSVAGQGFTVDTPFARFIDLGTEFGVFVGSNESSELHVIKGEVQYYSDFPGTNCVSKNIKQNNARRFNAYNNEIQAIPLAEEYFIRQMDSQAGVVWRGQKKIDLADIIGGGNGFGTGQLNSVIEANTGNLKYLSHEELRFKARKGDSKYHIAANVRYIDGVFVPDGASQINSEGYVYKEFPDTSGLYSCDLLYGTLSEFARPFVLEKVEYGTIKNHSIFMHANLGLTYDLKAIQDDLPGININRFCAKGGISESANGIELAGVDILIFIDNQLVYEKKNVKGGQVESVNIEIPEKARFLTIVVTEGLPVDAEIYDPQRGQKIKPSDIYSDWFLWAEPVLSFE